MKLLRFKSPKSGSAKRSPKKSRFLPNFSLLIFKRLRRFRRRHGLNQYFVKPRRATIQLRSLGGKYQGYTGKDLSWPQVVAQLIKSVLPAILPYTLVCGGYAFAVSLLHFFHAEFISKVISDSKVLPNVILSFNIILSLLLVFRTNSAHDRFWEGRKLWGSLVNTVRNLARDIWIVIEEHSPEDRAEKEATLRLVVAFAFAMKLHLRKDRVDNELEPLMSSLKYFKLKDVQHPPLEISFWIGDYLQNEYARGNVNVYQVAALQKLVDDLIDILGGCERILKTPMPLLYTILLKGLLLVYFIVLPWELVDGLTWWTAPIMAVITVVLLSIDEVGAEIEEPFGNDPNDLPLDLICNTMLRNVSDLIAVAPCTRYFTDQPHTPADATGG
ncbi:probable membrane protein STY1534 [uncultured Synechococcales cyanobacterium]|uniref:Probable membrane protein STY1534 n=1 Tax=uncultured Synechococcales cyanobacterium TaxID=1936017 RepID=A0A6J4VN70_9CYAN|nr:probable membrane protein STY1534 [uncultured Synechococcales cyanobacterium]